MRQNHLRPGSALPTPPSWLQGRALKKEEKGREKKERKEGGWTPQFLKRGYTSDTNRHYHHQHHTQNKTRKCEN